MTRYKTKLKPGNRKKSFPIWLVIAVLGLIIAAAWAFLNPSGRDKTTIDVTGAPKIKVSQDNFNYGQVKLGGTPIRTVIEVVNVGDQPLQFTDAPYIEVLEGC